MPLDDFIFRSSVPRTLPTMANGSRPGSFLKCKPPPLPSPVHPESATWHTPIHPDYTTWHNPIHSEPTNPSNPSNPLRRTRSEEPPNLHSHILNIPYSDVEEKYFFGRLLGEGVSSAVRRCIDRRMGEAYACKTMPKSAMTSAADVADVRAEVGALRRVSRHSAVAGIRGVMEDEKNVHIVMDACEGGDLFDLVQSKEQFTERDAALVCRQLISVVHYCHMKGIIHRDIKPENILLVSNQSETSIKVVDFGQAVGFERGEDLTQIIGTPYYMAPEIINRAYGPEIDTWSVGIILYILLCGSPPFWAEERNDILEKIKLGKFDTESGPWQKISEDAKDLVRRLLCPDRFKRIAPEEAKGHIWIQTHCRVDTCPSPSFTLSGFRSLPANFSTNVTNVTQYEIDNEINTPETTEKMNSIRVLSRLATSESSRESLRGSLGETLRASLGESLRDSLKKSSREPLREQIRELLRESSLREMRKASSKDGRERREAKEMKEEREERELREGREERPSMRETREKRENGENNERERKSMSIKQRTKSLSPPTPRMSSALRKSSFTDSPLPRRLSSTNEGGASPCNSNSSYGSHGSRQSVRSLSSTKSADQVLSSSVGISHHRAVYQQQWTASYTPKLRDRVTNPDSPPKSSISPVSGPLIRHNTLPVPPELSRQPSKGLPPSWRFNGRRFRKAEKAPSG